VYRQQPAPPHKLTLRLRIEFDPETGTTTAMAARSRSARERAYHAVASARWHRRLSRWMLAVAALALVGWPAVGAVDDE
jgi:hypothetical protein